ncbi:hypothetical protein EYC84_004126 [Monilinia fructicola]|uniref:Uncharacterized protein n=1 Tax=Monilinia fructicola TaxID=38448 RepID=A0A5M9K7Q9_MONFR|nr:hypothetical protein EYC84_004126 [Monilinia fructicola]
MPSRGGRERDAGWVDLYLSIYLYPSIHAPIIHSPMHSCTHHPFTYAFIHGSMRLSSWYLRDNTFLHQIPMYM